ncbi:ATP-binding cassette sub-family C member 5-like isoform X1 [Mercenaria mercenaria]|uniref:ATP-binding cassette sub-family C member 5-like isoform X1 n=2 Tax=Mercenaria mercenaria TaxID=6596 RepID=UPI00234E6802|nr:ATP-binding cassette sub-family C member 5-like isoform X1 [Mercenaria mercenaria]XP_053403772.1 ATP-binding cassette sub-family C member 5-like isoform X1 [Mercenaria mercenaria]XP_053403773.1 ATP-binding cassette sub-family C member 5-like isoform X1 [Mercenaria mercenaria]
MASTDTDKKNLLEKAEKNDDVSMTTEKVKDTTEGQPGANFSSNEKDLDNDNDIEIKDIKLTISEHDTEDVTMATKEESANEKTGLIDSDSSRSDSEDDREDVTMATESDVDDRIEDMTRSLLGLDVCGEFSPESSVHRKTFRRYKKAMKGVIPIRFEKTKKDEFPVEKAGCFSLMTFGWQTSLMWNIYRKGIDAIKDLCIGESEKAKPNTDRLARIWSDELKKRGPQKASLTRAVFVFMKTRLIFALLCLLATVALQFAGPAFVLHRLLSYLNSGDVDIGVGIGLVVAITVTEFGRTLFFSHAWHFNYASGVRVRAATQGLLFRKILKLRSLEDKTVGEIVNLLGNDSQRIFEAISIGPLMLPGPLVLVMGLIYMLFLIGPWSLIAMGIFGAFYPVMYFISFLTNYYRRKCIVVTDKRVRMMNELLTCIKLIKMYAWEKSFAKAISVIRAEERGILEKGAYVQSISTATAPIVPVMGAVFTFLAYVLTGNELTAVKAFTITAVLNSMRFTLGVLPFSVKALADAKVSFKRYKSILLMDEMTPHPWQVFNDKYALVLNHTTFKWDKDSTAEKNGKNKSKDKGKASKTKASNGLKGREELQTLKDSDQTNEDVAFVDTPTLQDLTLVAEKGKLIGICGSVGSGKSSLLSAVLGRMLHVSGKVAVQGSLAYVSQQAWVMNTTVRDNILFGETYDPDRYAAVVESCALLQDFSDFVDGDQTEIGERGINLSGGQKQRISLARAVYSNKDIYLLDDPLSAVDIHIGRHIFSECIMKQLKGKTVLFVTHQLQYLSNCDQVIFMRDGKITDTGTHSELMKGDTEYASLIKMFYTQEKEKEASLDNIGRPKSLHKQFSVDRPDYFRQRTLSSGSQGSQGSPRTKRDPLRQMSVMSNRTVSVEEEEQKPTGGKLIVAEEKKEGKVGWPVYRTYIKAAGGYIVSGLVILTFVVTIASQSFASWWLSYWLNQGSGNTTITVGNETFISKSVSDHPNLHFYTTVYGCSVAVMIVMTALRAFVFMKATLRASSTMHNDIFRKMMASPMKFFDTTPVGRIINRFSSDLDEIDVRLPATSEMFLQNMLMILFAIGIIAYVSPWFLIALVPLVLCFLALDVVFTSGVRELMRMNSITKSPVISHVTATVQGISTVHAYGKTDQFLDKFNKLLDKNTGYFYLFYCSNRWLGFRLNLMSTVVVGITGLCIVLTYDKLTPALAGLAFSFAFQMTGLFQFTIRQAIESEAKFVAVQRLQHYSEDVESEAPAVVKGHRPADDWPESGEIKFEKYKMRYRDNLPLALKGIGFTIRAKEKIGIVGRSGSGKSSLGVALFRLVEPVSGTILIDGVDITQIGLEDLRSRLAIIPQDPVLFVGTVRYNLDPFSKHKDSELWDALEKCHVKDTISSLELKLDHMVVENGENFSVGERQLLCMARALLRNSKILMLDEATAAIDTETDALVQKTIKEAFAECTMLIIAHRLNTVLGCDRILVMEEGKVVEYGRPKDLMASKISKFKAMLEAVEKQHEQL